MRALIDSEPVKRALRVAAGMQDMSMTQDEASRIERYLRRVFGNRKIEVDAPATPRDPAEMRIGSFLIGAVSKHEDEGDTVYSLIIDIVPEDLGNGC